MPRRKQADYQAYWDRNIAQWGELYLEMSHGHEALDAPGWFSSVYNATIARLEARLMRERYARTISLLDEFIRPGTVFADIGCGTGIFTVEALRRGAVVRAIDFSATSLEITAKTVGRYAPEGEVTYHQLNIEAARIPDCEIALAMGITPYVRNLRAFLGNILPQTQLLLCQYTDPTHFANRIRILIPALNVRRLVFHSKTEVDAIYESYGWSVKDRRAFATGFIDVTGPLSSYR